MIKANELRLGNLFDVINRNNEIHLPSGIVVKIVAIGIFEVSIMGANDVHYSTQSRTERVADLSPIPLTPEVLEKCGYTPDIGRMVWSSQAPKDRESDDGTKYTDIFYNKRLERWMDTNTRVCMDYLHQLQNLHFAHTGEELNYSK